MTLYWKSPMVVLYQGDASFVLRQLPAESVDLCVTSPPFWGLRDYRVEGQIGLEPTPEAWLEHILAVFREVRRVLRPWGTCWIEIGDSYASGKGTCFNPGGGEDSLEAHGKLKDTGAYPLDRGNKSSLSSQGLKPLDLVGIPFRLALALQQDKWWLRSVIIWDKPSPMPESVAGWRWVRCRVKIKASIRSSKGRQLGDAYNPPQKLANELWDPVSNADWADCPGCPKCLPNGGLVLRKGSWRPTEAHSYILMLAKSANYFANGEAVRESLAESTLADGRNATGRHTQNSEKYQPDVEGAAAEPSWYRSKTFVNPATGRNLRSVWHIGPESSSLLHFATFPTALPKKCILAGTSEWGNCPRCGMPWAPMIQDDGIFPTREKHPKPPETKVFQGQEGESRAAGFAHFRTIPGLPMIKIVNWRPTCACGLSERVAPVVLDPFVGTGTTCVAAQQLGRRSIGIDISARYLDMAAKRLEGVSLPLGARLPSDPPCEGTLEALQGLKIGTTGG